MIIEYKNKQIQKVCNDASYATKKYGAVMAEKLAQRIGEIIAADSVEQMVQFRIGRCHPLKGDRKNQYAVDLERQYRLIFKKKTIDRHDVIVLEIEDYH